MTPPARTIRVLGPAAVHRGEVALALPRSRKVRALLGYLALSSAPLSRSRLCDLLWDVPNDPRGELRWCLSKLRGLLDDGDRRRVVTGGDLVSLDLGDCQVDAVEVERLVRAGLDRASPAELAAVGDRFAGDLLDGTELDGGPEFTGWLAAQRNRYRSLHVLVLQALTAGAAGSAETFRRLDTWLQLAPFDPRAHEVMLDALVRAGRHRDAEDHLARAVRAFEHEGVDGAVLRAAWQRLKGAASGRVELTCEPAAEMRPRRRASVAIMPFTDRTGSAPGRLADGLTEDIIMQLAKLRVLFVIARGTVFALAERGLGAHEAGQVLGLDYVTSGTVARDGDRLTVTVELTDTRDGRIVWTDKLHGAGGETFAVLDAIVQRIVAAIAEEIEAAECQRAVLKPPGSLDAWEAYHRGLWHMYKFNGADNRHAEHFFRSALALDPTFARAHAGLSFTHFQNAFLDFTPDRDRQIELAFTTAGHSLGADAQDPSAHWAMGRALWLRGVQDEAFAELERSVELSPNFALGHYTLGFVHAQKGDPATAIEATNYSRRLSPFDPLQFAMLASRAMAHVRLDQRAEAADWAVKATARPNAHVHILAIAVECLALADRADEARAFVARIRGQLPGYSVDDFLRAFRFDADVAAMFRRAARAVGFDR